MKKHIISLKSANRFTTYTGILIITTMLSTHAAAQPVENKQPLTATAHIRHLASDGSKKLFQIQLTNQQREKFSVSIKDTYGHLLFSEVYQDENFNKKFQLTDIDDADRFYIIIRTLKKKEAQVFEISTHTRMIEDVVVSKL